LFALLKQS